MTCVIETLSERNQKLEIQKLELGYLEIGIFSDWSWNIQKLELKNF